MTLVELGIRGAVASYPRLCHSSAIKGDHLKSQIFYGVENVLWVRLNRLSASTRYGGDRASN